MTVQRRFVFMALAALPAWACGSGGGEADGGTDTDTQTEAEPDADADADGDGDTDTGPDPCSNDNLIPPFDPEDCPEQEPAESCVRFVDLDSAAEEPDGLSWETAFRGVQAGIDSARCGAIVNGACEVWVAEGRYHVYTHSRRETIRMMPGVSVYGGFAGDETALEQRDFAAHETILDGQEAGDGPCHTLHVVTGSDDAALDGFTVTGGRAVKQPNIDESDSGGGMLTMDCSPTVRNCAFVANEASKQGGGVCVLDGAPVILDCLFLENSSQMSGGGGMSLIASEEGEVSVHVEGCSFIGNCVSAGTGGAIKSLSSSASMLITDSTFFENEAQGAGAIGARVVDTSDSEVTIERCVFAENTSKQDSGAVGFGEQGEILVQGCEFRDNIGGGLSVEEEAGPVIENCVFTGNQGQHVGAIRNFLGFARVVNCTISGNSAALEDGAGGMYSDNCDIPCGENCPEIINSIVWGNGPVDVKDTAGATTYASYSDIGGGWPGLGNIDADPLFVSASGYDFHLLGGSPCIDAADGLAAPEQDFDGNERCDDPDAPNSGLGPPWADMGAFESTTHLDLRSTGRAATR